MNILFSGKNMNIEEQDQILYFNYLTGGTTDQLEPDPMLIEILKKRSVSPSLNGGRIRFGLQDGGIQRHYYLSDIAYACYHGYIKGLDTWEADVECFKAMKKENNLVVDHLDSNKHNNTQYNLSLMNTQLNQKKNTITARFMEPVIMPVAAVDNEYRICMEWCEIQKDVGKCIICLNLICRDASSLLECLNELAEVEPEWYKPLRNRGRWENGNGRCWTADADRSIRAQRMMAIMDQDLFHEYSGGRIGFLRIKEIQRVIHFQGDPATSVRDLE